MMNVQSICALDTDIHPARAAYALLLCRDTYRAHMHENIKVSFICILYRICMMMSICITNIRACFI